jgi:glycosyltransferase involved in cell wall biosynthesis
MILEGKIMPYNIRIVSTYPPRRCGIGTFSRDLANALEHFTSEIGYIRVAVIDKDHLPYHIPVDLVIDQYNPQSWRNAADDIIARAKESSNKTIVLLQHEYGLDPDDKGKDCRGTNYVNMAKTFTENGLTTVIYLHTVLDNPDEHQKKVMQDLARYSQSLIVTTESAIHILESPIYGIHHDKLKHIDHGIRMEHPSQFDRLEIKEKLGLKNHVLLTTIGLLSPDKGIQFSIKGFGRFINESLTPQQRNSIVYLIAGQCHPEFVKSDNGENYRRFQQTLAQSLEQANVRWCKVSSLFEVEYDKFDVVFLDAFIEEKHLLEIYGATNIMLLPYLNMQQISSGILADTLGSGRIAIATKFRYALELIHSNQKCPPGIVIGRHARGILVDPGEPSVEQIAQALDYLVFNQNKRLQMEKQAHQRGYQMSWDNTAWALLQHIDFLTEENQIQTGRGVTFKRDKPSIYQNIKDARFDDTAGAQQEKKSDA